MHRLSSPLVRLESRTVPATITVRSLADSGPDTLRAALAQADMSPGKDTIVFKLPAPPLHGENVITLTSGELTSKGDVTIIGPGAGKLIVSGNGSSRVFDISDGSATDSPATITGLSIVSGNASGGEGGGIYSSESLSLTGVVLSGNSASSGGAVYVEGLAGAKTVTISKSWVSGNSVSRIGGGLDLADLTSVKITNSTISGNTAAGGGGGIVGRLTTTGTGMTVSGCAVTGNSGSYGGGMFLVDDSTVTTAKTIVSGCTISGNTSTTTNSGGGGGGLYLKDGNLAVTGCTIGNNTAVYDGGGIDAAGFASLTIAKSSVTGNQTTSHNSAYQGGGGLFIQGVGTAALRPATISGCTVNNNLSALYGGGAFVTGGVKLTVSGSTFALDRAAAGGGGLFTFGNGTSQVAVSVAGSTFAGDRGGAAGGGGLSLVGDGPASVGSTKVTACTAGFGGGMFVDLSPAADGFAMTGCTISGNTATTQGGGVFIGFTPDFHVSGSSVTGNWSGDSGGGMYIVDAAGSVLGTTISGNAAATRGGGVSQTGTGTVTLQAAKVRGNTAPTAPDVDGTLTFV